jgi:hypothetical protein
MDCLGRANETAVGTKMTESPCSLWVEGRGAVGTIAIDVCYIWQVVSVTLVPHLTLVLL